MDDARRLSDAAVTVARMTFSVHTRPPYDVIAVHDCDGLEPPFAYTVGVAAAYGGPELFAWATPDSGLDPGERWALSTHDLHRQLTEAVDRLRGPEGLTLGDSWVRSLDAGRTAMVTTVVEADDVPSYEVPAGTPVWRLHLRLLRPPSGTFVPLDADARRALVERLSRWHEAYDMPLDVRALREDDIFGPGSCGVRLLLQQLSELDEDGLWRAAVLDASSEGGSSSSVLVEAGALARTAGRREWLDAAVLQVQRVGEEQLQQVCVAERGTVRRRALDAFEAAAAAWVLADLLDDELFRRGTASVRACGQRDSQLEHEVATPVQAQRRALDVATALLRGWRPDPALLDTLLPARAHWLLSSSGRGAALSEVLAVAGFPQRLPPPLIDVLRAAVVLDLDGELGAMLPPGCR